MKSLKIILCSLAVLLIIAALAGLVIITGVKRGALPQYEGALVLPALGSDVRVIRDERGMPHIYAENEHDLYYSTGYVVAQERLWQMDLIRRATTGRLSELFGESYVKTDLFLRSLDMTAKSKKILSNEDPSIIGCIQSYADGVNAYIASAGKKLPPEFRILQYKPEPWMPEDVVNIIGYMGWDLAGVNLASDIFNYRLSNKLGHEKAGSLVPDYKSVTTPAFPGFHLSDTALKSAVDFISSMDMLSPLGIHSFTGSNNWAISGKKSETGMPFFSNDMHLGLSSPGIWMQIHQVIPGKLNVTGVMVPGGPFIIAGHNEKIALGMTNLMVDDIDLFAEKINPQNEKQYMLDNEWKNILEREEIIRIKGGDADTLSLSFTHRGPVVSGFTEINDAVLTMRWSGFDQSDEIRAVYLLNRASGWEEFRTAISYFRSISQNIAYADVDGNIGLNTAGGIPMREGHGSIIRKGDTSKYDWKGYVPFSHLPTSFNPQNGHVSSANNKTAGDDYPYYISYTFAPPFRIERIRQMIEEKNKLGTEDLQRMITDQHSVYAAILTPVILKTMDSRHDLTEAEKEALSYLEKWDYDMNADLVAPSIFEFFRKSFSSNLLGDELDELLGQLPVAIRDNYIYRILKSGPDEWVDNIDTPGKETLELIVEKSFSDAVQSLSESYGDEPSDRKWGNIHKISLDHPLGKVKILDRLFSLNSDLYDIGGSNHTVCPYSYGEGFKVTEGASERHIFNLADWDESYTVIPTGASGIPASEFYLSQTGTYLEGKFYKDHFTEEAVKASAKYVLILQPSQGVVVLPASSGL